jgi:hypothetical protein
MSLPHPRTQHDLVQIDDERMQIIHALSALATSGLSHLHETARKQIDDCVRRLGPDDQQLFQRALSALPIDTPVADAAREEQLNQLAAMDPIGYDQSRKQYADALGIRAETLDKEVAKRRPHDETSATRGQPMLFEDPDPWPQPVDGAVLLEDMCRQILRYAVLPTGADAATALWALHTYLLPAAEHSPRYCATAPQKGCGKTLMLDLLDALSWRPIATANTTAAAVFRLIDAHQPTLLILNSGFQQSKAFVSRCVGDDHEARLFRTWCPVAIALIGKLPDTLHDRSIVITMRRKMRSEHVERLRKERLTRETHDIRRRAVRWANDHIDELREADPELPAELTNRAADIWRPLIAIADCAGGEWPKRARSVAKTMMREREDENAAVQLLTDIRDLFDAQREKQLSSETIVQHLVGMEDRPWPEWKNGKPMTQVQLARLLKPYIKGKPGTIRVGTDTPKGYKREQFDEAFTCYLEDRSATPPQPAPDEGLDGFRSATTNENVADQKTLKATAGVNCGGVAFWNGGGGQ